MRWAYVIPRVLIVGLGWLFFQFGFDPLLLRGLIYSAQKAARAKVEMAGMSSQFFSPKLHSTSVHIADRKHPGTNLIEVETLHAKLETKPLLMKSFIVDEATVRGLKWGTLRSDTGLLPGDKPDESSDSNSQILDSMKQQLLARGKDWLAGLTDRAQLEFDPQQFETVRLGQELEVRWPRDFGTYEQQIADLKTRIDELKRQVKVKGGNELQQAERYARSAQDVEQILQEIDPLRERLLKSLQQAQDDLRAMNEAKSHDLQKMKDKVDTLKLNPQQITEFLLGPELNQRLETTLSWARFLRERLQLATDEPKPERLRGVDILFKRKEELPRLLIRLLNLDGEGEIGGDRLAFRGTASGITSDPKVHGKPIIVQLEGTGLDTLTVQHISAAEQHASVIQQAVASSATISPVDVEHALAESSAAEAAEPQALNVQLKAVLDFTQETPKHQFLLSYKDPRGDDRSLGDPESISLAVGSHATNCVADLKLIGDDLSGQIDFHQVVSTIKAQFGRKRFKRDELVLGVVQDVVNGIDNLDAQLTLAGSVLKPQFQLRSNLGHELSSGINVAFAKQLDAGRREMIARFDSETAQQTAKLTRLYDDQLVKLTGQLQFNRDEVTQLAQSVGIKLPGGLDLKQLANGLPDGLKRPLDIKQIGGKLPKLSGKFPNMPTLPGSRNSPKVDGQADVPQQPTSDDSARQSPSGIVPAGSEVEESVRSLFGRKPKKLPR